MGNFVLWPEEVKENTQTTDLYKFFKLERPEPDLIPDEKTRQKLYAYLLGLDEDINVIRSKSIVMYLYISPEVKESESLPEALYRAALEITAEETTGTWDPDLSTIAPGAMDSETIQNMKVLQGRVIGINCKTGMVAVTLPIEGFEPGSLPQLASVIIGNYIGMTSQAKAVRLEDVEIPDSYANSFQGPALGPEGIWAKLGMPVNTPLMGTIVKPKTGLSPADWAKCADLAFRGGLDVVKDDENLTDQDYCKFEDRAALVLDNLKKMEAETGRKAVYVANVTAATIDEMLKRAQFIQDHGGLCVMIDLLAAGWTALQTLRKNFPDLIIHGHRAGHGAQTLVHEIMIENRLCTIRHGISMKVLAMFARLGGVDQLHIGAPLGKMEASEKTVMENLEMILRPMGRIKPCLAICSGGLSPDKFPDVVRLMALPKQKNNLSIVYQAGGGTHAHPLGTFGGAKAMIQARQIVLQGMSLNEGMNQYLELRLGFRRWQRETYDRWVKSLTKASRIVVDQDERPHALPNKTKGKAPAAVPLSDAVAKDTTLRTDIQKIKPELFS